MSREADPTEHVAVEELLGAYADGALDEAQASRVEAHLLRCEQCRDEVSLQATVRDRLSAAEPPPAPAALRERIRLATYGAPESAEPETSHRSEHRPRRSRWRRIAPWAAVAAAAVVATLLLARGAMRPEPGEAPLRDGTLAIDTAEVPMVEEAVADYRQRVRAGLPLEPADLEQLRARVPFPVTPLESPEARLLGAWTTEILGQPAAALAYQWGDRVVVQYIVSEALFFEPAPVRQAVAAQGRYASTAGAQGVVAWPRTRSGSILIGDVSPAKLTELLS